MSHVVTASKSDLKKSKTIHHSITNSITVIEKLSIEMLTITSLLSAFALGNVSGFAPKAFSSTLTMPQTALKMAGGDEEVIMNRYSRTLTAPKSQGASQAMLYATGLTEEDMGKPQVGICSVWYEGNPCNMHLLELSEHVKTGVVGNDLVGFRFNTVGVSDGISMGTNGMRFSLQSRDLIADSIETTMGAQWYDGLIALPGCDKNMPGCVMAMARLNRPSIMVYGGTIRAGKQPSNDATLDIVSAFQSYGQYIYDKISEEERKEIVQHSCPGPGACGGMYTANTMATAIEALGKLY